MNAGNTAAMASERRIGLIHTVSTLAPVFAGLAASLLPGVSVAGIVDESLLGDAIAAGGLTPDIQRRLADHVRSLVGQGAGTVMVTCSSLGPAVDQLAATSAVPLLRVDTAMAEEAVRSARRVGVLATLQTTLRPTADLVRDRAAAHGARVEVVAHLCEGAFAALKAGDTGRHDELVRAGLRALEPRVDLVLLAQASMARVLLDNGVPGKVPILTSPRRAVEQLARAVAGQGRPAGPRKE